MLNVGIFWVINGTITFKKESKNLELEKKKEVVKTSGVIDSEYGHFTEWNKYLASKYLDGDFATYPRGRVVYDVNKIMHIIYVDECIKEKEILKLVNIFDVDNYIVAYDDHYSCDGCIDRKNIL